MNLFFLFVIVWIIGGFFSFCSIMATSLNIDRKPYENIPSKECKREALGLSLFYSVLFGPLGIIIDLGLGWFQRSGGILFWRYDK